MREKQYRSLCEACDAALLAPDATLERVSIPWLHVIREHPVVLAQYMDVVHPSKGIGAWTRRLVRSVRSSVTWGRQILRALRSSGSQWFGRELPHRIDVLVVSHLLNPSQAGQADDFYFGRLPGEMASQGRSVLIALIDHTVKSDAALANEWKDDAVPRVILSRSLDLLAERDFRIRLRREARRLRELAAKEADPSVRRVLLGAAAEALSGGAQSNLRLARQIAALVAELSPKAIIVTFEGHAWERMAFAAARSAKPDVRCVGYQHAVLFSLQHAVRRNLGSGYDPDRILTAGAVSKAQLERVPDFARTPISVLGSNRGVGAGVTDSASVQRLGDRKRACLVLPEGFESECYLLFEFSLACARALPDLPFIWRLHPLTSFQALAAANRRLRKLPPNVTLSEGTLEEAVNQSRWVLYRGTTAVVKAVLEGVRPIYLASENELSIDPLQGVGDWRQRVTTINDFGRVIGHGTRLRADSGEEGAVEQDSRAAREYCAQLFTPFDYDVLSEI